MDGEEETEKPFAVDRAKQGRAGCKKCKEKIATGEIRIAKIVNSPFGSGKMKTWHHLDCIFEVFLKQRASTKRLDSSNELDGWDILNEADQKLIIEKWSECEQAIAKKFQQEYKPKEFVVSTIPKESGTKDVQPNDDTNAKDNLFKEFRRVVANIANEPSYLEKTSIIRKMFQGCPRKAFKGDLVLWCKMLLPGVIKRIYNLQSKQLVKLFSRIFETDLEEMLEHLEQGDIGETIQHFHEESEKFPPAKKSLLTMQDVDAFLEELTKLTKEQEQVLHFKKFGKKCTSNDLKMVVRLIKHDLRMNAGAKHVLDAVHPSAYEAYQASRDINSVIERCFSSKTTTKVKSITILTPVLPMLAEACKSIQQAMKKCPNGMYSEIKYDGERVQVHKSGTTFKYYSRSLKPVMPHKVAHFKDYIPQAFPHGNDLILDSEILMVDIKTGKPLPFGTLGVHKQNGLKEASVCLFVFDCIYYNGEDLSGKPLKERKRILEENMTEIPNHVVFSEKEEIHDPKDLAKMITKVLKLGLEGLVLKDIKGVYEPGKRHWLKVKKDYLFDGACADSADLIVLGAWYGTGKKGGVMSVFLMGVYDPHTKAFKTVTKVHTGHDDKTLERLQDELDMIKITSDPDKVPSWLKCTRSMVPDFVARDPKKQPVWEITGAEFTRQLDVHTANGISIRFPRVTKIRDGKNWETATNLKELEALFKTSKDNFDGALFDKELEFLEPSTSSRKRKSETSPDKKENAKSPKKRKSNSPVEKKRETTINIQNPLPDYFEGVNLLTEPLYNDKEILRQFVAYSGTLVEESSWHLGTHFLHKCDTVSKQADNCPKTALHVTEDWIVDSILSKNQLETTSYLVKLTN